MKQMHMEHLGDKYAFSELGLCFLELTQLNTDLVTTFRTLLPEYIFTVVAIATGGHIGIQNGHY